MCNSSLMVPHPTDILQCLLARTSGSAFLFFVKELLYEIKRNPYERLFSCKTQEKGRWKI